jgi:cyclophilin family peptidyl-prolyl cis-trans isomerase
MKVLRYLFLLTVAIGLVIATGCGGSPPPEETAAPATEAEPPAEAPVEEAPAEAPAEEPAVVPEKKAEPQAKKSAPAGNPVVAMETSKGTMKIELYPDRSPITVANFLQYADDGHFSGTIFHRVIKGFMIQGGGYQADMSEKPVRPPIKNESKNGLANLRGTISMATTADPDSGTSQFFINLVTNTALNAGERNEFGHTVFGKVIEGMDVLDAIGSVQTGAGNAPVEPVIIKSVRRVTPSAS